MGQLCAMYFYFFHFTSIEDYFFLLLDDLEYTFNFIVRLASIFSLATPDIFYTCIYLPCTTLHDVYSVQEWVKKL